MPVSDPRAPRALAVRAKVDDLEPAIVASEHSFPALRRLQPVAEVMRFALAACGDRPMIDAQVEASHATSGASCRTGW